MIEPLDLILRLREIHPGEPAPNSCLMFHLLLKAMYPNARGWYDHEHIITEIDGEFYDLGGIAERTERYLPFEQYGADAFKGFTETGRQGEIWS